MATRHETHSHANFPEISMDRFDVARLGDSFAHRKLREFALSLGYDAEQLTYRGGERDDLDNDGNFVHERSTEEGSLEDAIWVFTDEEFAEAADRADRLGGRATDSPLFYALRAESPSVAILDGTKLVPDEVSDMQYRPAPGLTFPDALIAVVNFSED